MSDDHFVPAPFADRHVAAAFASKTATVSPVVAVEITTLAIDPVSVTAVRSDAEIQLGKRNFGFEGDPSTSGRCRKNPHCASDGGNKGQFSH